MFVPSLNLFTEVTGRRKIGYFSRALVHGAFSHPWGVITPPQLPQRDGDARLPLAEEETKAPR